MKQRVAEMEMEAKKLREMQAAAEENVHPDESASTTEEDKAASDGRSIYVGNVCSIPNVFSSLGFPGRL
jgi:polyadenylate-binding protein 2